MRETANDVDIYWESEIEGDISRVIVLCSQEPCPIPNILVESLKEKAELKATVFSKLDKTRYELNINLFYTNFTTTNFWIISRLFSTST